MDMLKDLPSYDKDNFSRHSQGGLRAGSAKPYLRLRDGRCEEEKAQVIVMDTQSMLLRELEAQSSRQKRTSLKRSSDELATFNSRKVPKTVNDSDVVSSSTTT